MSKSFIWHKSHGSRRDADASQWSFIPPFSFVGHSWAPPAPHQLWRASRSSALPPMLRAWDQPSLTFCRTYADGTLTLV